MADMRQVSEWLGLALGLVWIILSGCQPSTSKGAAEEDKPVLEVGSKSFTLNQFYFYAERNYPELSVEDAPPDPELLSRILDHFQRDLLIAEHAQNIGIRPTENEVQHFIEQQMPGMTFELLPEEKQALWRGEITRRMAIQLFLNQQVLQSISISDAAVSAYYREHVDEFKREAQYRIRHVQTSDEARADAFVSVLKSGKKSFVEAAPDFSENDGYRLATALELNALPEGFQKALKRMKPGQFSSPIPLQYGEETYYHVLYLESQIPELTMTFEEAYSRVHEKLRKDAANALLESQLELFASTIPVKVYRDRLPFSYSRPAEEGVEE